VSATDDIAEMTCQEVVELVTEYFDDALDPGERHRFEEHLADCPYCDIYLAQMRSTIEATGRLVPEGLSPVVSETLLDVFRDWKQHRPAP
jgi:anti-sigma factor RsiW